MVEVYGKAVAAIESADDDKFGPNGGFTAVLSTPSMDRDGDKLLKSEWQDLPEWLPLDVDHGMTVADTIGKFHPYWDGDRMLMDAHFISSPRAQDFRGMIKDLTEDGAACPLGVSVAFITDKSKKDGEPRRELINAGLVAIPSNRDAVILASKAAHALKEAFSDATEGDVPDEVKTAVLDILEVKSPKPYGNVTYADPHNGKYPIDTQEHVRAAWDYINVAKNAAEYSADELAAIKQRIREAAEKFGIKIDGKSAVYVDVIPRLDEEALKRVITEIATKAVGGDGALVQAIHDASSHLGAACAVVETDDPDSGASDGANKSADLVDAEDKTLDEIDQLTDDEPSESKAFEEALDEILTPHDESPAEAAAASDEEPAPADEAADENDVEFELSARALRLRMLATHIS